MITTKSLCLMTLGIAVALGSGLSAQVPTEVPEVIPGARPVAVEHIRIHGTALVGNLEGDPVDRDVLVFLPPSYTKENSRRYPVVYGLHGYSIGAEHRAIAMDVGDQDTLRVDMGKLHDALDEYGIANTFEVYQGTHTSAVADRFQNHVMRFFSGSLCFQPHCR